MKIVIAGGSGFIGSYLNSKFSSLNHEVVVITRQKSDMWSLLSLKKVLENSDVLINLSGRSIDCVHTSKNKAEILNSRIETTSILSRAVQACRIPPKLWINASAIAIYQASELEYSTEYSTNFSDDFLANVVLSWESEFFVPELPSTRRVALRTSVVLGKDSGAFPTLRRLVRFGLGGKAGVGNQIFSWIHLEDYFRIIEFVISNTELNGPINCSSPNPISNRVLMKSLRKAVSMPFGLPAPKLAVAIGAMLVGTDPDLILSSANVYPRVLLDNGFVFKFDTIGKAFDNLLV